MPSPEFERCTREIIVENRRQVWAEKLPKFSETVWQETGKVLSALNNGVKAALHVMVAEATVSGTYMPIEDIFERFRETFAGTELLEAFGENRNTRGHIVNYCRLSLCDVGLLEAEYNFEGQLIGFGATENGRKALPNGYLILWWEDQNHKSLFPILGPTQSRSDTRAPYNRMRILYYIAKHRTLRESDIVTGLGIDHGTTGGSLNSLAKAGLIDYKAVKTRTGRVQFEFEIVDEKRVSLSEAKYPRGLRAHYYRIVEVLQSAPVNESFSVQYIFERLPQDLKDRLKERVLRGKINSILNSLATQGFLHRVDEFKAGGRQSFAETNQKGKEFIHSFLLPQLILTTGEPLSDVQKHMVNEVRDNFTRFAQESAELYYPHSISKKRRERKQMLTRVIEVFLARNTQLIAEEIADQLRLSTHTIYRYLVPQIKDSETVVVVSGGKPYEIRREKRKGVWYYYLGPNPNRSS